MSHNILSKKEDKNHDRVLQCLTLLRIFATISRCVCKNEAYWRERKKTGRKDENKKGKKDKKKVAVFIFNLSPQSSFGP